jgi:hypothetical protein
MAQGVLSSLSAVVAGGSVAIIAGAAQAPADIAAIPWDKFLGVGSGGLAFGVAWYFLKREEAMRAAHERVVSQHLDAASKISGTFSQTVDRILAENRAEYQQREQRLIEILSKR